MNQHTDKVKEKRMNEIAEEKERLRFVQQDLKAEAVRNKAQKDAFTHEAKQVVEYK